MVTLIRDSHRARETALVRDIGSTGKGIGAARADRVMRSATVWGDDHDEAVFVGDAIRAALQDGWTVQVEGAQGYGLGLHTRFYPFCTSGDCRAIDMLAAAGVSPWFVADDAMASMEVWLVYRSLPIRVAGPSGPLEDETTWGELGLPPEHTTVTNRVRRVGWWDARLALEALRANGGPSDTIRVVITGLDLLFPRLVAHRGIKTLEELEDEEVAEWIWQRESELGQVVTAVGIGPKHLVWQSD
jgi:adenylosuccinate synthase